MRRLAMDVATWERKPRADGKLVRRAGRAPQNDFGGKDVTSKPRQGGDLYPQEFTDRMANPQMMGSDV
jgi:hypothetical protein